MTANGRTVLEYSVRLPTGIRWVRSVGISSKNPFYFRPESGRREPVASGVLRVISGPETAVSNGVPTTSGPVPGRIRHSESSTWARVSPTINTGHCFSLLATAYFVLFRAQRFDTEKENEANRSIRTNPECLEVRCGISWPSPPFDRANSVVEQRWLCSLLRNNVRFLPVETRTRVMLLSHWHFDSDVWSISACRPRSPLDRESFDLRLRIRFLLEEHESMRLLDEGYERVDLHQRESRPP